MNFLRKAVPWVLCAGCGALFAVPYFFEGWFVLSFLALALFFYLLERPLKGKWFRGFLIFFCAFYGFLYSFFSALYPMTAAGYSETQSLWIVIAALVLVPAAHAALSALVLQFGRWLPAGPLFRSAGFACLWVVHEFLCTLTDMAFPWSSLSVSQTGFKPLLQTASLFGSWGIAFAVVCISFLLGQVIARRRILFSLSAAGTLLTTVLIAGLVIGWVTPKAEERAVQVALLQGNASTDEKWDTDAKAKVLETYLRLADEAGSRGAQWIVLPESAVAANFTEGGQLHELYAGIAKKYGATVFAGILQTDESGVHNGFVAILPDGSVTNIYEKQHLVPFGEQLPFGGLLNKLFPSLGNLGLGGTALVTKETEPLLHVPGTETGCYLCYDAAFPSSGHGRADVCIVATNDSWFDKSGAMLNQSLRFAQVRAAETGKEVLRAANTGISAFIDAHGTVLEQSEPKTESVLIRTVHPNGSVTLYTRIGNGFVVFCAILLGVLLIGKALTRIRRRS